MIINLTKEEAEYLECLLYFCIESTEKLYIFMDDEEKKRQSKQYQLERDIIKKIQEGENGPKETK